MSAIMSVIQGLGGLFVLLSAAAWLLQLEPAQLGSVGWLWTEDTVRGIWSHPSITLKPAMSIPF